MLAATIVRGAQDAAVQKLFAADRPTTNRPAWQRAALLRGAEVALLGAPMPGTPRARRGGAPAPRGERAVSDLPRRTRGPGRRVRVSRQAPGGRPPAVADGRDGVRREPRAGSAFSALARRSDGDLGPRAADVLARVEWPGKPGAAAPIAPLTPEEQQRFDAGREVYRNICQACHQPDGRGQDRVAPPSSVRRSRSRRRRCPRASC